MIPSENFTDMTLVSQDTVAHDDHDDNDDRNDHDGHDDHDDKDDHDGPW